MLLPQKTAIVFNERFMALLYTRKDAMKNESSHIYFLIGKGLSNDGVGVGRGTVIQEIPPRAGFKTGDFVTEKFWVVLTTAVERPENKNKKKWAARNLYTS